MATRDVVLVVFPGLQGLDLIGPAEVFAAANQEVGRAAYRIRVVATAPGSAASSSGVTVTADEAIADVRSPIDTLLVVGGDGTYGAVADEHLVHHVARLAKDARRVTSVCSGSFVLAQAGLLDGKRATTHWRVCDLLARELPGRAGRARSHLRARRERVDLRRCDRRHGSGSRPGRGRPRTRRRPRHRPALRAVPSPTREPEPVQRALQAQSAQHDGVAAAQHHVAEHPDSDCSVAALARVALMSERSFARTFTAEVGVTPARYVERVRMETARRLLEDSDDGVETIAAAAGFGTAETMRRTFLRHVRTSPTEYRRRFRAA